MNNMNFPGRNSQAFPGEGPIIDTSDKGFDLRIDDIQHLYETSLQIAEAFGEALGEGNELVRLSGAALDSSNSVASVTSGWAYYQGRVHRVLPATITIPSGNKAVWVVNEQETADETGGRFLDDLTTQFNIKTISEITIALEASATGRLRKIAEIDGMTEALRSFRGEVDSYTRSESDSRFGASFNRDNETLELLNGNGSLLDDVSLSEIAWSGEYNDLQNKPTITNFVSWASDSEQFLKIICAGRVGSNGQTLDFWGPNNVGNLPFNSELVTLGELPILRPVIGTYIITHNIGNLNYGVVGMGVNNGDFDLNGRIDIFNQEGNIFSVLSSEADQCIVALSQGTQRVNGVFTFMIYSTEI